MDTSSTPTWRTSTYSGGGNNCVEIAELPDGGRLVRDTKDREGGTLSFTSGEWAAFTAGVRDGEFD